MLTFSYKGYDFEVAHQPTVDEFAQMSAYVDTLPPKEAKAKVNPTEFVNELRQQGQEWGKGLQAGAETAASLLSGVGAMAGGPIASGLSQLTSNPFNVEHGISSLTYEPRTELGKELAGKAGEALSRYVVPAAVGVQGLPYANTLAPIAEALAGSLKRVGKPTPKASVKTAPEPAKGVSSAIDEMAGKAPEVAADPMAEFYKQQALDKQQQLIEQQRKVGEQPITVDTQGRASTLGATGPLETLSPMERVAQQLGAERPAEPIPETPMSRVAADLTAERSTEAQRAAQDALEARQTALELETRRQTSLDLGAERLQRREAAPTGYAEHAWEQQQRSQMTQAAADASEAAARLKRDTELAQRAGSGEQASLFEPHTNMHRPFTEVFAKDEKGTRFFSFNEFKEVMQNLAKEPGTAFELPADLPKAYQQYKEHSGRGQQDLFGAHTVETKPSHVRYGDLSPQQRAALTKKAKYGKTISDEMLQQMKDERLFGDSQLRSGFTAEDMSFSQLLHKFGGPSPLKNIPGVNDRLKQIGNARIETPELAIKLAKEVPDVSQNALQRGINYLTKGGIYLKAKLNNPVVHFTVDRFLKAESAAKAEISQKLHGDYLTTLRDLSKEEYNTAFKLLNAADLYQKPLTSEFLASHNISPKVQEFIQMHKNIMNDALAKINAAREAAGKKPIEARVAYSAMNMTGDFRKVVTKNGEVVGVIGSNTKTVGKNSLSKLEASLKEKDPMYEFGPMQDMSAVNRSNKGTPHEAFLDVLDVLGEDNPHIKEFLDTLKEVAKDDPNNYMGMQKHTMQKKGVFGMEGRKPWMTAEDNATAFFENQVKYLESAFNWSELASAAKDVNEVIRNGDVIAKQNNAIALSEQYMQNALGLNPSRVGNAVTNMMNTMFTAAGVGPSIPRVGMDIARRGANTMLLSLNPAFLGIQLLQSPAVLPSITAMLRGLNAAPKGTALTFGFNHAANAMIALGKYVTGKGTLTAIERSALDYAQKNHIYATDLVEHTNQTRRGAGYYMSKVTQTPAAKIEAGTRAHMFMTIVDMMNEAGVKPKDGLFEQAHRFTDMAMNHYGAIEKPQMYNALGPIGSMAYNLRSFGHNEISRWALYARELSQTGNASPLLTQMASTITLAGVMGLPFFSQWESIYDFITKKLGKPRSLAMDVMDASEKVGQALGPQGAYALSNGAPTLLGVDLSKRTGLGDVLPSAAADVAFAGGSKLGQMAKSAYQMATSPSEETAKAAAITWAPPIAQGPMDVAWYQKGNLAYSKDPEKLKPVAQRSEADILLKKLGLSGINESSQKQKVYQQDKLDKAYQEYRTTAMRTIAQDLFRDRPIEQKTIDRYFVTGQGDPASFARDLDRLAIQQNMSPEQYAMLRQATSKQIPQLQSLIRRTQ